MRTVTGGMEGGGVGGRVGMGVCVGVWCVCVRQRLEFFAATRVCIKQLLVLGHAHTSLLPPLSS